MREKDIKRPLKRIDLKKLNRSYEYRIIEDKDLFFFCEVENDVTDVAYKWNIDLLFGVPHLRSDITVRIVNRSSSMVDLTIKVIALKGANEISSTLDMKGLLIGDGGIYFTPVLEVSEMDVQVDHRSTIGTPDPIVIEFMRSRGIDSHECIELISQGFLTAIGT